MRLGFLSRDWRAAAVILIIGSTWANSPALAESKAVWQPPPDAVVAPQSATPGRYDFTGITSVKLSFSPQPVDPVTALDMLNHRHGLEVGQVPAQAATILGRLRIVLPDHDRLRVLALQATKRNGGAFVEFRAEEARLDIHEFADAVVRGRLFTAAEIVEQNDTDAPDPAGADYVLWFAVRSTSGTNAGP